MISVYNLKPRFQKLLAPLLSFLHQNKITPNHITSAAIVLSGVTGIVFWYHPSGISFLILPLALLVRMALNALDGMMAKTYHMQSQMGEILNELGDVVSDFLLFFPLIKLTSVNPVLVFCFVFMGCVNEFVGVLAKAVSGHRRYDGPMGKSDRALSIGLFLLLCYFFPFLLDFSNYFFGVLIFLMTISTVLRIKKTLHPDGNL